MFELQISKNITTKLMGYKNKHDLNYNNDTSSKFII